MGLPGDKINGIIMGQGIFKVSVAFLLEGMTRILLRSRRAMAVGILLLLAGVVVLSTATRKPFLHVCTGTWHLWKAGHMTTSEGQEIWKLRTIAAIQRPHIARGECLASPPPAYLPHKETIPPALFLIVQVRHFRAPPALA